MKTAKPCRKNLRWTFPRNHEFKGNLCFIFPSGDKHLILQIPPNWLSSVLWWSSVSLRDTMWTSNLHASRVSTICVFNNARMGTRQPKILTSGDFSHVIQSNWDTITKNSDSQTVLITTNSCCFSSEQGHHEILFSWENRSDSSSCLGLAPELPLSHHNWLHCFSAIGVFPSQVCLGG